MTEKRLSQLAERRFLLPISYKRLTFVFNANQHTFYYMELLVYKASAGSGKTFTLAVEYIKHLIKNPRAYRQILAVTFTNKATTEMKERILQQLYGIWIGDPASTPYHNRIMEDLQGTVPAEELRNRAGMALQYMLHDYSRFRVETIDSFFQSVMRNLARELELNPNLNIELNSTDVLDEAVDSLIEKLTPDSPILAWLLDYINERIADDKRWNVSDEIKNFGRYILDENYIERGEGLRQDLHDASVLKTYKSKLKDLETEALERMKTFNVRFEKELDEHGLRPEDLKNGLKGISSYFRKLSRGELNDKDVVNATLKNSMDSADNWASRTSPFKQDIKALAERSLIALLEEAERTRPEQCRQINTCRLTRQHLNKLQLLNHINEEMRTLNQEKNRFLLSDTNTLLHKLVHEGDSSFVFEKIGTNLKNVMIDEFQDTSRMQWDNFRLLLLEGLSQGEDSLIVGDVKQSIYRWRNGDWRILNELGHETPAQLPFRIRVETLKTNRRSETRIIEFNNHVFRAAVSQLNEIHKQELGIDCLPLEHAYADVEQESPKAETKGYVKVEFLEPDDERSYQDKTLEALGKEVEELLSQGVRLNDMAILVRKNKNIPPIADYFDKMLNVPVVSDEAFRLDASLSVNMLIDALRCLTHPDDSVSQASLTMAYQTQVKGYAESPDILLTRKSEDNLPLTFIQRQEELKLMPLYELLEELVNIFSLTALEKQEAYLFTFFDAVTEYLQSNSSEPESFLRYWDEKLCAKTIPSGEIEGIRIFSIHKSKGLEFHTVLIPFCDWKLENETNNQLVWCVPEVAPYDTLELVPINYSTAMATSIYRNDYLNERLQLWVDSLNLLYVAFTRAGKNLIVWSRKNQRRTIAELLAKSLPQVEQAGDGIWHAEEGLYEWGSPCASAKETAKESTRPSVNRLTHKQFKQEVRMINTHHDIEFRQSNPSADFIAGVDEEESIHRFIHRGNMLHTLFSSIRTEADIEEAINRLIFDGIIGNQEMENEVRELAHHAFSLPQVKEWYDGSWRLFNECDIIWMENGKLKNRRPDRVMMRNGEIVVVDFKFGKPHPKYNRQVQEYMRLLTRMGYDPRHIQGHLWYVDENRVETVEFTS